MGILHRGGRERFRGIEMFHNLIVQWVTSVYKTHQAIHLKKGDFMVCKFYISECDSHCCPLTPQVAEVAAHHTVFAASPVPWDPAAWLTLGTGSGSKEALQKGHFSPCPSD